MESGAAQTLAARDAQADAQQLLGDDQRGAAFAFFRRCRDVLRAGGA
jgi:hypothetical protein